MQFENQGRREGRWQRPAVLIQVRVREVCRESGVDRVFLQDDMGGFQGILGRMD